MYSHIHHQPNQTILNVQHITVHYNGRVALEDITFHLHEGERVAVVAALGIGALSKNSELKEDTAIGIIFAGMFALGIALISTVRSYAVDLSHFLFGDVLSVSSQSLWLILIFGGLALLIVFAFYKEFLTLSFVPGLAATLRLPVGLLNNLLLALMAVTVAVSLQTVGVALMVAMLVTPAATAYLLTRRLSEMRMLATIFNLCLPFRNHRFVSFLLSNHRFCRHHCAHSHFVLFACLSLEKNKRKV